MLIAIAAQRYIFIYISLDILRSRRALSVYSKSTVKAVEKSKRLVTQTRCLALLVTAMGEKLCISLNEGKKNAGASKSANGGEKDEPSFNPKKL